MYLDDRDSAHQNSFYAIALFLVRRDVEAKAWMRPVKEELFKSILWPIKNPTYFWSNSEGFTKKLADKFKCLAGIKKGTNFDQVDPANVYFALTKDHKSLLKFVVGLCLRAGFMPNFEHVLLKPQAMHSVFRAWHLWPLYIIVDFITLLLSAIDYNSEGTSCKIRLFTYLLLAEKTNTQTIFTWLTKAYYSKDMPLSTYFSNTFYIYFGKTKPEIYLTMDYHALEEIKCASN